MVKKVKNNAVKKKVTFIRKNALEEEVYEIKRKVIFIRKHVLNEVYRYKQIEKRNVKDGTVNRGFG